MRTIELEESHVEMIDQTLIPWKSKFIKCESAEEVAEAIEGMKIRGAPALGAAAGMGLAVTVLHSQATDADGMLKELEEAAGRIAETRPTAANLFASLDRVMKVARNLRDPEKIRRAVVKEAQRIADEDVRTNREIGKHGAELVEDGDVILTHCNAGALATVDYGTALGVIRGAIEGGKQVKVIATETRPFLQGARLTAWELKRDDIPVTLITDNMVGYVMAQGDVDSVVVGADRIAANGDTANKIGTYSIAVIAERHHIPFYVAAPTSTVDMGKKNGSEIEIEHRDPDEVRSCVGKKIAPEGIEVLNPAFDVTPSEFITKIITELGVVEPQKLEEMLT